MMLQIRCTAVVRSRSAVVPCARLCNPKFPNFALSYLDLSNSKSSTLMFYWNIALLRFGAGHTSTTQHSEQFIWYSLPFMRAGVWRATALPVTR